MQTCTKFLTMFTTLEHMFLEHLLILPDVDVGAISLNGHLDMFKKMNSHFAITIMILVEDHDVNCNKRFSFHPVHHS